ncbi:MAG: hypothetical protein AB1345_05690 [Chloroflexota bacterium]
MSKPLKVVLWVLIVAGFVFGYAGFIFPDQSPFVHTPPQARYQFQRLHIFLFNLVSGGTILIYFTEGQGRLSRRGWLFLAFSLICSVAAFLDEFVWAILAAVVMVGIVESVRVRFFPRIPLDFFKFSTPVSCKFHYAAVLCLSIGLLLSATVMVNNQYLHLIDLPTLILNNFFLGFSFPLSLITFAVMFSMMHEDTGRWSQILREASFWIVTVGVIVFFVVILLKIFVAELFMAFLLLADVLLIFTLFMRESRHLYQEAFFTSGLVFLVATSLTGILIILWPLWYPHDQGATWELLYRMHAYLSLCGWNLSGLTVISRYPDFPLKVHETGIILAHWATIALLSPLGNLYYLFALTAIPLFAALMWLIFFSPGYGKDGKVRLETTV